MVCRECLLGSACLCPTEIHPLEEGVRKWGSLGGEALSWSPHQWDWCPYKSGPQGDPSPLCQVSVQRGGTDSERRARPLQGPNLPAPPSRMPRHCAKQIYADSEPRSRGALQEQPGWTRTCG